MILSHKPLISLHIQSVIRSTCNGFLGTCSTNTDFRVTCSKKIQGTEHSTVMTGYEFETIMKTFVHVHSYNQKHPSFGQLKLQTLKMSYPPSQFKGQPLTSHL